MANGQNRPRILAVDDSEDILELILMTLSADYDVVALSNPVDLYEVLDVFEPDLLVLDVMMPRITGFQLTEMLRKNSATKDLPIIMLTARTQEQDLVQGLDAGADDYLSKPFSTTELMARIRALLRRKVPEALDTPVEAGLLKLDPATRRVHHGTSEVSVGPTEFRLLRYLMTYPERVHSRAQLLDRVWGDHVFIEERTVDVHIKRLRDALAVVGCSDLIETVRGAGYRLARPVHSPA